MKTFLFVYISSFLILLVIPKDGPLPIRPQNNDLRAYVNLYFRPKLCFFVT